MILSGGSAMLYASVGHGGASAYLALLALGGFGRDMAAPTALALNILASGIGAMSYYRAGHFNGRLLLPFVLPSIPAAYIGATLAISERTFAALLGGALLIAAVRFLLPATPHLQSRAVTTGRLWGMGLPIGFSLGFVSGLIGIGGGIFLSPLLLFLRWADARTTAAVSAPFILLNSLAGLAGHLQRGLPAAAGSLIGGMGIAVAIGGMGGAYTGAFRLAPVTLQRILGTILLMAGVKLILVAL